MPPPPLIASVTGQRLAVAALMAMLLGGATAAAYAFAAAGSRQRSAHQTTDTLGAFSIELTDRWQAQDPGPWADLLAEARVYRDLARPSRSLAAGTAVTDPDTDPRRIANDLITQAIAAAGPVEVVYLFHGQDRVEACLTSYQQGMLVQHLLAVATLEADADRHAVLYLSDTVTGQGAFQRNRIEFHAMHQSVTPTP